ncbi:MAG: glucosaminidase domain-containing protein [Rhodospirillales bacterium]|nr:glucosaminidase domain-containing protein [Rhodospirillales bacterium]
MTARKFDRLIFSIIGCAVIATAMASLVSPKAGLVASPRISFDLDKAEEAKLYPGFDTEPPPEMETAAGLPLSQVKLANDLAKRFEDIGYHLESVKVGDQAVPRVFLTKLPSDLHAMSEVSLKKTVFFQAMLPLILQENERIARDRQRLLALKAAMVLGDILPARDRLWIAVMAERYKVKNEDMNLLLRRVDIIPPSLAMAQAAEESGWGTSRFAQSGNAVYGQWTTADSEGLIPEDRADGMDHKIKAFDNLEQSVASYMRNLNTHRAYLSLRRERSRLRTAGQAIDGVILAGSLVKYSERGVEYVESIRTIINVNGLRELDDARLVVDKPDDDQSV